MAILDTIRENRWYLAIAVILLVIVLFLVMTSGAVRLFKGFIAVQPGQDVTVPDQEGAGDQPAGEQLAGNQAKSDQPADDQSTSNQPAGEQSDEQANQPNSGAENNDSAQPIQTPKVVSQIPLKNTSNVSYQSDNALVIFDQSNLTIDSTKNITMYRQNSNVDLITTPPIFDPNEKVLKIAYPDLYPNTTYTITIPRETVYLNGNQLESDISWSFTTKVATNTASMANQPATQPEDDAGGTEESAEQPVNEQGNTTATQPTTQPASQPSTQPGSTTASTNTNTAAQPTTQPANTTTTATTTASNTATQPANTTTATTTASNTATQPIETPDPTPTTDIQLEKAKASPAGFNPQTGSTSIIYKVSDRAKVNIDINALTGVLITNILDDFTVNAGEYIAVWDGKDANGTIVMPGSYTFKITVRNPLTDELTDTKSGNIVVAYAGAAADFEVQGLTTDQIENPPTNPIPANESITFGQGAATMAMHNASSGQTADTGPETALYFIFPIAGLYFYRKFKNTN